MLKAHLDANLTRFWPSLASCSECKARTAWSIPCCNMPLCCCHCRTVGVRLGAGESLHDILSSSRQVAEGVSTAGQLLASDKLLCLVFRPQSSYIGSSCHIIQQLCWRSTTLAYYKTSGDPLPSIVCLCSALVLVLWLWYWCFGSQTK